ncbi:hypothetical protein PGT21_020484 [Puccinia graminis f. sp. tritici]|uniref:Uncharacterized protein n=1 Tax=Puccinia graminis f. sp. tritici TaxID=56615 RepID=A0A5B0PIQ6_PUCGR|nr:hypothetical protein PGT21_020484 [Puccinia graminis f. sp. tritici]
MHLPDAFPHFPDPQSEGNRLGYLMEKSRPVEEVLKPHGQVGLHRSSQDSESSSLERQYTRDEEAEQINRQPTSNKGICENRTVWGRKDPAAYLNSPRPSLQTQRNNQPGTPVSLKVKPSVGTKRQGEMCNNSLQQRMKLRSYKEDTGMLESSRNQINPTLGYMEGWSSEKEAPTRGHQLKDIDIKVWPRISSIWSTIDQTRPNHP